jgi:hypothetical protein
MGSIRRFKLAYHLDGANAVTVEMKETAAGGDWVVSVRPKGKRRVYTGLLTHAIEGIVYRDAKQNVERS